VNVEEVRTRFWPKVAAPDDGFDRMPKWDAVPMWFAFEAADELVKAQDAVTAFWSVGWWRLAQQS